VANGQLTLQPFSRFGASGRVMTHSGVIRLTIHGRPIFMARMPVIDDDNEVGLSQSATGKLASTPDRPHIETSIEKQYPL
jgi:hypothetical protein